MATTLPLTIKPSTQRTTRNKVTRVLETGFGNGYSQRAGDGINSIEIHLNLFWVGSNANINSLEEHFEERQGYKSFNINDVTIAEKTTYRWICKEWDRDYLGNTLSSLSANLIKVNDLV